MATMAGAGNEELAFAGVARLGELLREREVTPRERVELYLRRIERLNPQVNAFVSIQAEKALAEADAALARLRAGQAGGLLGVPAVVKDNVDIAGEVTTHGTAAQETAASADAEAVRRLRAAGAPILGKTTLPELATCGQLTESSAYGVTRNPWDRARSAGGTSGGSPSRNGPTGSCRTASRSARSSAWLMTRPSSTIPTGWGTARARWPRSAAG
jgi:amidase